MYWFRMETVWNRVCIGLKRRLFEIDVCIGLEWRLFVWNRVCIGLEWRLFEIEYVLV